MMDGRVKTLHPRVSAHLRFFDSVITVDFLIFHSFQVAGSLLAIRSSPSHVESMSAHGIIPTDLLVCKLYLAFVQFQTDADFLQVSNLYPFESVSRSGQPFDVCVENIDIGGPTMIRAAAKNHAFVTVITSPSQFSDLIADMEANGGCTSLALRKRFAAEAFRVTAHYDSMIARWMSQQVTGLSEAPEHVSIPLNREISLKYGCNPHQLPASVYSITGTSLPFEVS
jgi:phosphoribosylaminoimidazolecarboxamide formyltransferase/IMP cyclohydrolase